MIDSTDLADAVAAYRREDPSLEEWPDDAIAETFGFQVFRTVWEAERIADDLEVRGFADVAEALRTEFGAKAQEINRRMAEARDSTLREMGLIR